MAHNCGGFSHGHVNSLLLYLNKYIMKEQRYLLHGQEKLEEEKEYSRDLKTSQ